jgi:hypothetical protein
LLSAFRKILSTSIRFQTDLSVEVELVPMAFSFAIEEAVYFTCINPSSKQTRLVQRDDPHRSPASENCATAVIR